MNQIVPHRAAEPAPPTAIPTKAEQIARGLRRVNETLIAPRERIREATGDLYKLTGPIIRDGLPRRGELLSDRSWGEDARWQVRSALSAIPTLDVLRSLAAQAEAVFGQTPDRAQNRLLIGVMVDAFPNARPHSPEMYFEVLAHEICEGGFAPVAVACALRDIVLKSKFLPSIAEAVEACEKEAAAERSNANEIAKAIRARELLEEAGRLVDAFEAGERNAPPAQPKPAQWKEGDAIPF